MASSHCWGPGLVPGEGTKILLAVRGGQKKKVKFILTPLLRG